MSERFSLNKEDVKKWLKNAALFFAPALLVFLIAIEAGTPREEALYLVYLWALNVLIDLTRKFLASNGK
jgi:hypothetical protein